MKLVELICMLRNSYVSAIIDSECSSNEDAVAVMYNKARLIMNDLASALRRGY